MEQRRTTSLSGHRGARAVTNHHGIVWRGGDGARRGPENDLNADQTERGGWTPIDRVFFWNYRKDRNNLVHQLLHTSRPGTLDTSLISSDQINNPRTMNAVYDLPSRVDVVARLHQAEHLKGAERKNYQFSDMDKSLLPLDSVLRDLFKRGETETIPGWLMNKYEKYDVVISPRVLKDAADSVGA